jgi:hypothetical protein
MMYSDVTTALGDLLEYVIVTPTSATPSNDTNFNNIIPRAFEYTEGRIYRELDFVSCRTIDFSTNLTANSRTATLPTATSFFVVQGVNVITPVGAMSPQAGTRNRLEPVSTDFIDSIWPTEQSSLNTVPEYSALLNATTLIVAPTPDQNYMLEYVGIIRPMLLSATNTSNYITLSYPELYIAACMIFLSGWQRDFSAQSGEKDTPMSWENTYQTLKQSALEEEQRRKTQSTGWSPYSAAPLSTPQRS